MNKLSNKKFFMFLLEWVRRIQNGIKRFFLELEKLSLSWVYLVLGFCFGVVMTVANPPFAGVPDEHAHYWKAWSIAEGYLWCTGQDQIPRTAQELPEAIKPVAYEGIKEKKIIMGRLKQFLFEEETIKKGVIGGANCPSTPFGYIPQVVAFRLGSALGLSALGDVYLGRFLNFLTATFLVYLAIRIAPFGKIVFLLVGLFPLTVQQFASLSYDALQISLALLFFSYVLHLAFSREGKMTWRETGSLFLLALVGLNIKLGYFPLVLLAWLIPARRFSSKKKYFIFQGALFLLSVLFFLVLRQTFVDMYPSTQTNPAEQLQFVLHAPIHFLNVVFETVYGSSLTSYVAGVLFRSGWGSYVSHLLILFIFSWVVFLLRSEKEEIPLTTRHRWIIGLAFFANFLLIYLALYMGWTAVGADKVSGVQGRYLVSLVPLFIFLFYRGWGRWDFAWARKRRNALICIGFLLIFGWVFQTLYQNYYLKEKPGKSVYERYLENKE